MSKYKYYKGEKLYVHIFTAGGKTIPCIMEVTENTTSDEPTGKFIVPSNHHFSGTTWEIMIECIKGNECTLLGTKHPI